MSAVIEPGLALVERLFCLQDLVVATDFSVKDPATPPFEGFSERVTDGSDDERQTAYGRWLKRLRGNQERSADDKGGSNQSKSPEDKDPEGNA